MNKLSTFMLKQNTKDGYPAVMAGICPFNLIVQAEDYLGEKIKDFKIDAINNPFYIDYMLASYINTISPEYVYALGVSIHIPGISGPTGGIIGSPLDSPDSAGGVSEYIGNGLSVAAHPGGPGIVISGSTEIAEKILNTVNPGEGGKNILQKIVDKISEYNIGIAIIISDGTGTINPGCAMTIEDNKVRYVTIDKEKDYGDRWKQNRDTFHT